MSDTNFPIKRGFVFPGQGSQSLGMGKDLAEAFPAAAAVFEEVNDALGEDLTSIMWGEDLNALTLTENAQPALMAVSLAVVRALESEGYELSNQGSFVAGHSLGEYSALAAAGVLTIRDTAKLLKLRGSSMQAAVSVGQGAMAAIIGLSKDQVEILVHEVITETNLVCALANDNAPGQAVISGALKAVEIGMAKANQAGAKRALKLPVSAPFHCELMAPAAKVMGKALSETVLSKFNLPLIANVTAEKTTDTGKVVPMLVEQITGQVRWTESMQYAAENGITQVVELGAGKVLSGLSKRIDSRLSALHAGTLQGIEALIN